MLAQCVAQPAQHGEDLSHAVVTRLTSGFSGNAARLHLEAGGQLQPDFTTAIHQA